MKQSYLNEYLGTFRAVCGALQDCRGPLSAYPAIQPLVMNLTFGLERIALEQIRLEVESAVYGDTPWAKLYTLQTGREVRIPRELKMVEQVGQGQSHQRSYEQPLRDIVRYLLDSQELEEMNFSYAAVLEGIAVTIALKLSQESQSAELTFAQNDMVITMPDFTSPRAVAMCPLFSEPYHLELNMGWLVEQVFQRLYVDLVPTPVVVADKDRLLADLDSEAATALAKLLRIGDYRGNGTSTRSTNPYVVTLPLRGRYAVTLCAVSGYGEEPYLQVSKVQRLAPDDRPQDLHHWYKNSPLVQDLLDDIDGLIDRALTAHTENTPT